jgi:DNA mismatch repair protein MutL
MGWKLLFFLLRYFSKTFMASKIRILTEETINQIKAGEVIENAASVIKELVENSLDAGATQISVEISGGGRQLIRVRDNGSGMNGDDALLSLERHATSKIREVEDLHALTSMGFRGEALPSIASISKLTMLTSPPDKEGTLVQVEGGKILSSASVDCAAGTSIEVKELFYNVPARRKFQKSPQHDTQQILKSLTLLALGNPEVKFELISNKKSLLSTGTGFNIEERIREVLGVEFFHEMCPIEAVKGDWSLQGYVGMPACTRHNRTGQFLFINRRAVVSPLISYAVREGYGPALAPNRHPLFILHLELPGELVDVNVHPQKKEVRMRQEQAIRDWLIRSVEAALPQAETFAPALMPHYEPISFPPLRLSEALPELPLKRENPTLFTAPALPKMQRVRAIATLPGYIVTESPPTEGLGLIDQRRAHARLIFERLSISEEKGGSLAVQNLLIPYTLELTSIESALLQPHLERLNRAGISIKEFGRHSFVIDALPQIFGNADISTFLHDLISSMREWENIVQEEKLAQIALTASRASVSRSRRLSLEEAQLLVNQLMECEKPHQCPKGHPTQVHLSMAELTKYF